MNRYVGSKLIIVEGLTGSGKSIMAHFLARQLQYNGIPAGWVHEGQVPHPILRDIDLSIENFMDENRSNWVAYRDLVGSFDEVRVMEACFFNNLLETLLAYNVEKAVIIQFVKELQSSLDCLNPTLVYLVQDDVEYALARNFKNRGTGFRNFVIEYATSTPLAHERGWEGYAGMLRFWQAFVELTDELYDRFPNRKLKIDTTTGDWERYNQQVLEYLALPWIPEQRISQVEALGLLGLYKDRQSGREFTVQYDAGSLTIDLTLNIKTRLIRRTETVFVTEGWPFEIRFLPEGAHEAGQMKIGGSDVDYLPLRGTIAVKAST